MVEDKSGNLLLLVGVGFILGAAFVFIGMRKQQQYVQQTAALPAPAAAALPVVSTQIYSPEHDINFIKWYTETIVKPSIETAARQSAENAIRQHYEKTHESQVKHDIQALDKPLTISIPQPQPQVSETPRKWIISRDDDGAITSIEETRELQKTWTHQPDVIRVTPFRQE